MSLSKHTIAASASIACLILSTSALAAGGPPTTISLAPPVSASGFQGNVITFTGGQCTIPNILTKKGQPNTNPERCDIKYSNSFKLSYDGQPVSLPNGLANCGGIAVGFPGVNQGCSPSGGTACTAVQGVGYIKVNATQCG